MTLPFDLRHLQAFQAVVGAGSLTAGAEVLHVSQPAVSATIGKLERSVGIPLLTRTARGVEPTVAGRYLLDASTRILGAAEETAVALAGFGTGTRGALTVAAVPTLLPRHVPELLAAFTAQAPDVEVTLLALPPWQAIDLVQSGGADLALVLATSTPSLAQRGIGPLTVHVGPVVPLRLAVPADGSAPGDTVTPVADLGRHTLLAPRRTPALPSLPEAVEEYLRSTGTAPAALRTVDTIQTILPLVAAGHGVGLVPAVSPKGSGVALRRLDPEPPPLRVYALQREARDARALARLVAAFRLL